MFNLRRIITMVRREWFIFIFVFFYVGMGVLPVILAYTNRPTGHTYTGLLGFIDDYVGYTSYIKEGIYGKEFVVIRSLPPENQSQTLVLYLYILLGKIGGVFGWNAPFTYHATRAALGSGLVVMTYLFFRYSLGSRILAVSAVIISFLSAGVSWIVPVGNSWTIGKLASFSYAFDSTVTRAATRHHHMFGAILFLFISLGILSSQRMYRFRPVVLMGTVLTSFFLGTAHPHFGLILLGTVGLYSFYRQFRYGWNTSSALLAFGTMAALVLGMVISRWGSREPQFLLMFTNEKYASGEILPFSVIRTELIAFGPVLWTAIGSILISIRKDPKRRDIHMFVFFWLVIQLLCFFFLYRFLPTQRIRFVQSLFFIPMGYGAALILDYLSRKLGKWTIPVLVFGLVSVSVSSYANDWRDDWWLATNYGQYPAHVFPTEEIAAAYQWLDRNTPLESTVLSGYDASNNILLYSHNFILGNKQGWADEAGNAMEKSRDAFLAGLMTAEEARLYVNEHQINYIYDGYQEPDGFRNYPFVKPVYQNPEVSIFQVL